MAGIAVGTVILEAVSLRRGMQRCLMKCELLNERQFEGRKPQ